MPKCSPLSLVAVVVAVLSLTVAGCSPSGASGGGAGTTTSAYPLYTPTAGPGDPVTSSPGGDSDPEDGSSSTTPPPVSPEVPVTTAGTAGTNSDAVTTDAALSTSGATGSTITVMPTRPTVTLALSASITASAPPEFGERGDAAASKYAEILRFIDRAHADPKRDWNADIVRMFAEPYKSSFVDGLKSMNQANLRSVGHVQASAVISSLDKDFAELVTCLDVSQSDLVDAIGNSVVVGESESNKWKFVEYVEMILEDDTWKISSVKADRSLSC